jgi:hypothetical protein
MKATAQFSKIRIGPVLLYFAGVVLFLMYAAQWHSSLGEASFVDAKVYARAINIWRAGGNPYAMSPYSLPFVYPPIFLKCVAQLARLFPEHVGWYVYLAVESVSLLAIPWILTVAYVRSRWLTPFLAMVLFTFQPRYTEEYVLLTGNVANLFYPLALAAGILGIKRNRWLLFYVVVAVASVLKPPFLGLLILPLLAGERQLIRSTVCVGAVVSVYSLQRILMPQYYAAFQQSVFNEVVARGDAGSNIFNYLHRQAHTFLFLNNPYVLSAIHVTIVGTLVAAFFLMRKRRTRSTVTDLWVPALLVIAILANPRMQDIDADIAIIPALYLILEGIRRMGISRNSLAGLAVAFTLLEFLLVKQFEMGLLMILYGSVFLVLFLLIRERAPSDPGHSKEPQDVTRPAEFA